MGGKASNPEQPADFALVVEEHWTSVYRLLYHLAGNTHDADDLTQETFLKALDRWETFVPGTNLRAWLLRIANNLFLDIHRKKKRIGFQPLNEEAHPAAADPGHALETREQAELVRAAMEELSEVTRLVFHLRVTQDLSFREIGKLAGITEEAARWHMHQARSRLLKRLACV